MTYQAIAPPWFREVLFVNEEARTETLPPWKAGVGLRRSIQIAPPKPPPLAALALKALLVTVSVLARTWIAPPLVFVAVLPLKLQLPMLTIPKRVKSAPPP